MADGSTFTRTGNQLDYWGASGTFVAYDQLPEAFRQKVSTHLDELRKAYKDANPGDFGNPVRKTPPPSVRK
jgi:hypothetical protein